MKGPPRARNANGQLRRKRSDTHVGTVEKTHGRTLGGRSDRHLGTLLKQTKKASLSDLLGG